MLATSALLLTLAIPQASFAAQKETETVDRTVTIGDRGTLKLNNFSGDVKITGSGGVDVVIHAVRRATRERLQNVTLEITHEGSSVKIDANKRDPNWKEKNNNVVETDFEIQVPRGTALNLDSFSGKLEVIGVSGEINAETFSGDIVIDAAEAGQVPAMTAETFSGNIQARVPAAASGKVRFNSFSGSVRSDLPIDMGSRTKRRDFSGDLGNGSGPTLSFTTFSGNLRIQK